MRLVLSTNCQVLTFVVVEFATFAGSGIGGRMFLKILGLILLFEGALWSKLQIFPNIG